MSIVEVLLGFGLVALVLVVLQGIIQQKKAVTQKQKEHDDGQVLTTADPDLSLSPAARAVIDAAQKVIGMAQRKPWGVVEIELIREGVEQIYDVVTQVEKASQPAPLPPLRPIPPDPMLAAAAGNGQGQGQPDPNSGAGNPNPAVS